MAMATMAMASLADLPSCFASGEVDLDFGFFGAEDHTGPDMMLLSGGVAIELAQPPTMPPTASTTVLTPPDSPLSAASESQDKARPFKRLRLDEDADGADVPSPPATPRSHSDYEVTTIDDDDSLSSLPSPSSSSSPSPASSGLPDSLAPSALRLLGAISSSTDDCAGGLVYASAVRSLASSFGASICTALDRSGLGIAHYAAAEGCTEALAALRDVSTDVHSWVDLADGHGGCTPLAYAVARRHRAVVAMLLEMGASVSAGGAESALRVACAIHDASTLSLLLRAPGLSATDVNAQDIHGQSPLHAASASGDHTAVEALLASGAQPSLRDKLGITPLIAAVSHGSHGVLDMLSKDRTALNTADRAGRTPLHWAAACGSLEMTAALFKAGAKLELRDRKGRTPLLTAAQCGHRAVVDFLLMRKACATVEDNEGHTLRHATY